MRIIVGELSGAFIEIIHSSAIGRYPQIAVFGGDYLGHSVGTKAVRIVGVAIIRGKFAGYIIVSTKSVTLGAYPYNRIVCVGIHAIEFVCAQSFFRVQFVFQEHFELVSFQATKTFFGCKP